LFALKLSFDSRIKNFKISTNNKFWCDFDDAVFEIVYKDNKTITLAVQLKHTKQNMTIENVTSVKGDYSLDKYYKSYKKIREQFSSARELESVYFVLYTTGGYSKTVEEFRWHNHHLKKRESVIPEVPPLANRRSFQFSNNNDPSSKSAFLSRFFVYTNQNDHDKSVTEIRNLIQTEFESTEDIFGGLFDFVEKWRRGQLGPHYKLTRNEFITEVCGLLLTPYIAQPPISEFEDLKFVNIWNSMLEKVNITFIQDFQNSAPKIWYTVIQKIQLKEKWSKDKWMTPSVKLDKTDVTVPKRYLLNKTIGGKLSLRDLYLAFWKTGLVPLILSVGNVKCNMLSKIFQVVLSTAKKKYFVVCTEETNIDAYFSEFSTFRDLTDVVDFHDDTFEALLTLRVKIQDRFQISLKEMIDIDDHFLQNITPDVFLEMMENQFVGTASTHHVPKPYIERKISEFHVELSALKYIRNEIVFIFCDLNIHYELVKDRFPSRVVEFKGVESDASGSEQNIFLAHYSSSMKVVRLFLSRFQNRYHIFLITQRVSGSCSLKWIESTAPVDLLKQFINENGKAVEEKDFFSFVNNPINVISAVPGMGKSSLINHMCQSSPQNFWMIKIDLIEHSTYFEEQNSVDPLEYFYNYTNTKSKLTRICFDLFAKAQNVIFLFDGFDEISPKFTDKVLDIIDYFKSKNMIQCITIRPIGTSLLEKRFNVLCYSIRSFSLAEKRNFITTYKVSFLSDNLQTLFHNIMFTFLESFDHKLFGVPLQMSMLCETINNSLSKNVSNFKNINVLELYENFIDAKMTIFEEKYLNDCNPICYDDFKEKLRESNISNHQICSLITVFGQQAKHFIKQNNINFLKKIREGQEKLGIITQVGFDNTPVFLHQTYAEYFAATWLAENWKHTKKVKKLFIHIFSSKTFSMVRLFFDRILTRHVDILGAVLDQNCKKIERCSVEDLSCTDELGRNALHLACSWKPKLDTKYVDILLQKIDPKANCDKLLKLTPVEYADRTRNVVVIDKILQYFDLDLSKLKICLDVRWLLHRCIKLECVTLLTKFAQYLNSLETWVVTLEYDNLLFAAVEKNNVEVVKILLGIDGFRKHVKNEETHGRAAVQLAIMLGHEIILKNLMDFDISEPGSNKLTPYEVAVEESREGVKQILKEMND
jgi:hypothetical protein